MGQSLMQLLYTLTWHRPHLSNNSLCVPSWQFLHFIRSWSFLICRRFRSDSALPSKSCYFRLIFVISSPFTLHHFSTSSSFPRCCIPNLNAHRNRNPWLPMHCFVEYAANFRGTVGSGTQHVRHDNRKVKNYEINYHIYLISLTNIIWIEMYVCFL